VTEKARILLTNDDGINAPGLKALKQRLENDFEVWVVAPDVERSTSSHAMSLRSPLFVEEISERSFSVRGLPADCVYLALHHFMPAYADLVISGINAGANMGKDVFYSGTVAAAREGAFHGIRALASSLVQGRDFRVAADITFQVASSLLERSDDELLPLLFSLNIPGKDVKGLRTGVLGLRKYPKQVEKRTVPVTGEDYYWLGGPPIEDDLLEGTDGWLVRNSYAAITPLSLDQTQGDKVEYTAQCFRNLEDVNESQPG